MNAQIEGKGPPQNHSDAATILLHPTHHVILAPVAVEGAVRRHAGEERRVGVLGEVEKLHRDPILEVKCIIKFRRLPPRNEMLKSRSEI